MTKLRPRTRRPSLAKRLTTRDVADLRGLGEGRAGTRAARKWLIANGIAYQDGKPYEKGKRTKRGTDVYTTVAAIANLDDGVHYAELMQRERER